MVAQNPGTSPRPDALASAIYLGALVVPPLGSTVAWLFARRAAPRSAAVHYRRALQIQLAGCAAVAGVQGVVVAAAWIAAPWLHGPAGAVPRLGLVFADVAATVGIWLAMALVGPVVVLSAPRAMRRSVPRIRGAMPAERVTVPIPVGSEGVLVEETADRP